jgi:hypothetical protein
VVFFLNPYRRTYPERDQREHLKAYSNESRDPDKQVYDDPGNNMGCETPTAKTGGNKAADLTKAAG